MAQNPNITLSLEGLLMYTLEQENRFLEAGVLSHLPGHQIMVTIERRDPQTGKPDLLQSMQLGQVLTRKFEKAWIYIDDGHGIPLVPNSVSLSEVEKEVDGIVWKPFSQIPNLEGPQFVGHSVEVNRNAIKPSLRITTGNFFALKGEEATLSTVYLVEREALEKLKHENVIVGAMTSGDLDQKLKEKLGADAVLTQLGTIASTQLTLTEGQSLVFCLGQNEREIFRLPYEEGVKFTVLIRNFPVTEEHRHQGSPEHPIEHVFHSLHFYSALTEFMPAAKQKVLTNTIAMFKYFGVTRTDQGGTGDPLCPKFRRADSRVAN